MFCLLDAMPYISSRGSGGEKRALLGKVRASTRRDCFRDMYPPRVAGGSRAAREANGGNV